MKKIFLILLLLTSFTAEAAQQDSSLVQPPSVNPVQKVQVNVLHMTQLGTTYYTDISPNDCPTGSSLVWYKYFPLDISGTKGVNFAHVAGKMSSGVFAYVCRETFYESEPYYQSLKAATWANPWVPCEGGANAANTRCSTLLQKPPFVLFIFKVPASAAMKSWNEFVTFRDASVFFNSNRVGQAFNNDNIDVRNGPLYFSWYLTSPNTKSTVYWYFQGDNAPPTYGQDTSSARGDDNRWGYYRCSGGAPGTIFPFSIEISPIMAGQTCTVTCKGDWTYDPKVGGQHTWWSQYDEVTCKD